MTALQRRWSASSMHSLATISSARWCLLQSFQLFIILSNICSLSVICHSQNFKRLDLRCIL